MDNVDTVRYLEAVLTHPGWQDVIKPALEKQRAMMIAALVNGGALDGAKRPISDDEFKGHIKSISWVLAWEGRAESLAQELKKMSEQDEREPEPAGSIYDSPAAGPEADSKEPV